MIFFTIIARVLNKNILNIILFFLCDILHYKVGDQSWGESVVTSDELEPEPDSLDLEPEPDPEPDLDSLDPEDLDSLDPEPDSLDPEPDLDFSLEPDLDSLNPKPDLDPFDFGGCWNLFIY